MGNLTKKGLGTLALCLFLVAVMLSTPVAGGTSEKVSIPSVQVRKGEKAKVPITLSSVPNGLSGFEILVSLENSKAADIEKAKPPAWAALSENEVQDGTVRIKAVDLEKNVQPGAENVKLGTLLLENTERGATKIVAEVKSMDDDDGNPIEPEINPGSLKVVALNKPPEADVNSPYSVKEKRTVKLDGTGSSDPDNDPLTYSWSIVKDPTGKAFLAEKNTPTPVFHAPSVDSDTKLTVKLEVKDGHGHSDESTASVTVQAVVPVRAESVHARPGEDATSRVSLGKTPQGVSGYEMEVTLEPVQPSALPTKLEKFGAEYPEQYPKEIITSVRKLKNRKLKDPVDISGVSFPDWAALKEWKRHGPDNVYAKAADIKDKVKPGEENVTLNHIKFENTETGVALIVPHVKKIDDDNGNPIPHIAIPGVLSVWRKLPTLPGKRKHVKDPDGDGLCEDVNGNGKMDFDDLRTFYDSLRTPQVKKHSNLFDFNGNGRIDFDDVVELFHEI